MRSRQGAVHVIYSWLVVGLAVWQLAGLFPALELDSLRELLTVVFLGVLAECLAVPFPHGQLSGGFALILSSFLIYGPAAAVWVNGLAALIGQGIANRGNPVRTVLFNAGQYTLAAAAACLLFQLSGGVQGLVGITNIFPLLIFTAAYVTVNHLLVYLYLLPRRHSSTGRLNWSDAIRWDGLTYLFTVPQGILIAMIYKYTGLTGTLTLFFGVLALQFFLRFYVRLQVTNRELTTFYQVARFLEDKPSPVKLMEMVLRNTKKAVPFHNGVAYLRQEEEEACLPAAATGPYAKQLLATTVFVGEGIIGQSLENRKPDIVFDTRNDPRARHEEGLCQVMRSLLIIPLFSGRDALGVIVLGEKRPLAFDEKHLHIMTVLAGQASIALENSVLRQRLDQAVSRDTLTGLLSFNSFSSMASEICESSRESGFTVGLIILDIDRFKAFDRHYGREAGEMALEELALLIVSSIRTDDITARYGGDEFALLLPGAGGRRLHEIAEILWRKAREHTFLRDEGRSARLTVSVGLAEFPQDAGDAAGLFRAAQRALDKAKAAGGDCVESAAVLIG
ncbi:sensor domain-containing diguanylate cyclase [Pelotomaculum propionicicum]|uniref:sensor domain-containing diguanylate cyclase n=1 Tax=Pelotomaculum propionicicum TaxID=258475 RepID=UPI0010652EAC|nr:sensor domain-containing diguanylate cyclase [Pelotomaculum propionicicum]NLI13095.1 GGDEF domain-containing protein [Peptococcaceae bacterium]